MQIAAATVAAQSLVATTIDAIGSTIVIAIADVDKDTTATTATTATVVIPTTTVIVRRPALLHPHACNHHRHGATTFARAHHPIAAMHLDLRWTTVPPSQSQGSLLHANATNASQAKPSPLASARSIARSQSMIPPLITGMPPTTTKSMVVEAILPGSSGTRTTPLTWQRLRQHQVNSVLQPLRNNNVLR